MNTSKHLATAAIMIAISAALSCLWAQEPFRFEFEYNDVNRTATLTKFIELDAPDEYPVTIPAIVSHNNRKYTVTQVNLNNFSGEKTAYKVYIPSSVDFIDTDRYFGYGQLMVEEFIVSSDNKKYTSRDGSIYSKDMRTLVHIPTAAREYKMPAGVVNMLPYACTADSLKRVELAEGLRSLSEGAFMWNTELESVKIPSTIKSVGRHCFWECKNIKSIVLPEGVEEIGEGAFYKTKSVKKLDLPSTVKHIGEEAFQSSGIEEFTVPPLVTDFDGGALQLAFDLKTIKSDNPRYIVRDDMLYTSDMKTLVAVPVGIERGSVKVPEGVERIGRYAFCCTNLYNIALPSTLRRIEDNAFYLTHNLKNLYLPESVEEIGVYNVDSDTKLHLSKPIGIPLSSYDYDKYTVYVADADIDEYRGHYADNFTFKPESEFIAPHRLSTADLVLKLVATVPVEPRHWQMHRDDLKAEIDAAALEYNTDPRFGNYDMSRMPAYWTAEGDDDRYCIINTRCNYDDSYNGKLTSFEAGITHPNQKVIDGISRDLVDLGFKPTNSCPVMWEFLDKDRGLRVAMVLDSFTGKLMIATMSADDKQMEEFILNRINQYNAILQKK